MSNIKLQHILTITELLALGARYNFVEITTSGLAKDIKKSQQAASHHLLDLENAGYIERHREGQRFKVKITYKGFSEIENLLVRLKSAVEHAPTAINLEGRVMSGMGEGSYYMSLFEYRKQFREKLGYEPFPGTLNLKLVDHASLIARREISQLPCIFINGFSDNTRTFGWAKCYRANINNDAITNAAILILERTHYDDSTLEVIAPISIKDTVGIKNGDKIKISVQINHNTTNGTSNSIKGTA